MREQQASRTARSTAAMRAAHLLLDDSPPVLEDRFAAALLSFDNPFLRLPMPFPRPLLQRRLRRWFPPWLQAGPASGSRRTRAQIVTRSRYAEDLVLAALERGTSQYVVLAAGLDSFALRHPELAERLEVLEVDHPATQAWKVQALGALPEGKPDHLTLVPFDFERQTLSEALASSPFNPERPAVFSWLGITYYLSHDAILETLRFVAAGPKENELVFDFWSELAGERESRLDGALLDGIRLAVAAQSEPMLSFFDAAQIGGLVASAGLELVECLSPEETDRRYLAGRRDGLRLPRFAHLAHVRGRSARET